MRRVWRAAWPLFLALACATERGPAPAGSAQPTPAFEVVSAVPRGGTLDVRLVGPERLRLFVPDAPTCRNLLAPGARVDYDDSVGLGRLRGGGAACLPVGVGDLGRWRDRQGRGTGGETGRDLVRFRIAFQDRQLAFLRGEFPLVHRIRWAGGAGALAAVSHSDHCRAIRRQGFAFLVYRDNVPEAFALVSGELECPIEAFLEPAR